MSDEELRKEEQEKIELSEFKTGYFLGQLHKKGKSPPMYCKVDERPFAKGYIKGYYEK